MAKVQNFLQNSGFAKVKKVERNKQTNGQIHTRVILTRNTLIADFVVCLFVYFGNKSKRVGKKEIEELNKGLNYVQRKIKQQKTESKNMDIFLIKSKGGYTQSPLFTLE